MKTIGIQTWVFKMSTPARSQHTWDETREELSREIFERKTEDGKPPSC